MRIRRPAVVAAAASIALIAPLGLAGCFPSADDIVGGLVESGIESVTGSDIAVGSLPKDFPSEVPVADGRIEVGFTVPVGDGRTGWSLTVQTDADAEAIAAQLEAAGFHRAEEMSDVVESLEGTIINRVNGTWSVSVIVAPNADGPGSIAHYMVGPVD